MAAAKQRWLMPFVSIGLCFLLIPLGVPSDIARGVGLLGFALTGWAGGWLHPTIVSLLIVGLTPLLGLGSFEHAVSGYGQPFIWLLVSTFVLSSAMEASGLGRRVALLLLRSAGGRSGASLLAVLMTVVVLGFLIPSSAARSSIVLPICASLILVVQRAAGAGPGSPALAEAVHNFARAMFLGVGFVGITTAWSLMTGSISSVYAAATVEELTGYQWTYLTWAVACLPILLIFVVVLWGILLRLFPPGFDQVPGGLAYLRAESAQLGPLSATERRIGLILAGTLALWLTEPLHGLSVPHVGLLAAIASCLPGIGAQDWPTAAEGVKWDVVLLFGAGSSLASSLVTSGTAEWMAQGLTGLFPSLRAWSGAVVIILAVTLVRFGFANMLAIVAVFLPIAVSLSATWGLNGAWLAQIALIASSFAFFLPVQTPSTLMAHAYGYFTVQDMIRSGVWALLALALLTVLFALYVWPMLGIAPR